MLFLRGARQLVTLQGAAPRRGAGHRDLGVIRDGALLIDGDRIEQVGTTSRIAAMARSKGARVIDVSGRVILPGFVDCHTHLAYATPPLECFEMRLAGAQFDATAGPPATAAGGSLSTAALAERSERWLRMAAAYGVTSSEVRCDGDLDEAAVLKSLRAVRRLGGKPQDLSAALTFSAARPGEDSREDALPRARRILKKAVERERLVQACDIDFSVPNGDVRFAVELLAAARNLGLAPKLQGDRFRRDGGSLLAADMGAASVAHAVHAAEGDIDALAASPTAAVLLPAVSYHLGSGDYPPARQLIDAGATTVLASGFGMDQSPTHSMSLVLSLACREMRMMPEEAIAAATINAAAAIGRSDRIGSLEPGKQADLAVFDVSDYREIPYYLGLNLCVMTLKRGVPIHPRRATPSREGRRLAS